MRNERVIQQIMETVGTQQDPTILPCMVQELADRLAESEKRADYYRQVIIEQQTVLLRHNLRVDVSKKVLNQKSFDQAVVSRQQEHLEQLLLENEQLKKQNQRLLQENRQLRCQILQMAGQQPPTVVEQEPVATTGMQDSLAARKKQMLQQLQLQYNMRQSGRDPPRHTVTLLKNSMAQVAHGGNHGEKGVQIDQPQPPKPEQTTLTKEELESLHDLSIKALQQSTAQERSAWASLQKCSVVAGGRHADANSHRLGNVLRSTAQANEQREDSINAYVSQLKSGMGTRDNV